MPCGYLLRAVQWDLELALSLHEESHAAEIYFFIQSIFLYLSLPRRHPADSIVLVSALTRPLLSYRFE